jgi:hypothetical protein
LTRSGSVFADAPVSGWRWARSRRSAPEDLGRARRAFKAGFLGDAALKPDSRGGFYEFLSASRAKQD